MSCACLLTDDACDLIFFVQFLSSKSWKTLTCISHRIIWSPTEFHHIGSSFLIWTKEKCETRNLHGYKEEWRCYVQHNVLSLILEVRCQANDVKQVPEMNQPIKNQVLLFYFVFVFTIFIYLIIKENKLKKLNKYK